MHHFHRASLVAGALLLAVSAPAQTPGPGSSILPFDASERTLANGLKVIVVPTGFPNIVSLQIPVMTGSRNEVEAGQVGLRALLRAHDVPRHARSYPPEAYNGDRDDRPARRRTPSPPTT